MRVYALWASIIGFLFGVLERSFFLVGFAAATFLILLAAIVLGVSVLERKGRKAGVIFSIAVLAFVCGVGRAGLGGAPTDTQLDQRLHTKVVVEGVVAEEPDARETSVRVHIDITTLRVGSTSIAVSGGVLAVAPAHTEIAYGDVVSAQGQLELPESFDTNSGRKFNYPKYLEKDGIKYMLNAAEITPRGENRGDMFQALAIRAKQAFIRGVQAVLPEPEAGLADGITVGDKRSVGKDLTDTFKTVSLIHVIVLSGYNITIVINTLRRLLVLLPRIVQYTSIVASVIFVVLMTGGAPSAVRAGVMSLIAVYARASARQFIALRILGVVALGMVMWNPMYLAFDPGFQLSVLATLGLILFTEPLSEWLTRVPAKFGLREIVASTIATQTTVLPLLLYQNGLFSVVALPANLFALIAIPYAMFATLVAAIGGMLVGAFAIPLAAPAYVLLWYVIGVAQFFESLPYAAVSVPAFSVWWVVGSYALLGVLYLKLQKK